MDKATLISIILFALNNELAKQNSAEEQNDVKLLNLKMPSTHWGSKKNNKKTLVTYANLFGIDKNFIT